MTIMHTATRFLITTLLGGTLTACGDDAATPGADSAAAGDRRASASAPAGGGNAVLDEMSQHQLTMDDVRKWAAITPKLEGIDYSKTATRDLSESPSIDELDELYSGNPQARAAIEGGGMDVRDYVVTTFVLLQGGFAQHMIAQGANRDSVARTTNISKENLEFLEKNSAEIARIQSAMRR